MQMIHKLPRGEAKELSQGILNNPRAAVDWSIVAMRKKYETPQVSASTLPMIECLPVSQGYCCPECGLGSKSMGYVKGHILEAHKYIAEDDIPDLLKSIENKGEVNMQTLQMGRKRRFSGLILSFLTVTPVVLRRSNMSPSNFLQKLKSLARFLRMQLSSRIKMIYHPRLAP